jgi:hypothetical protein
MTRPPVEWPSVTGAVITSLTVAASDQVRASLCSVTAGTRTGKLQAITETPSLTSARFAGTGTRAAERPRDRSISPERERQFGSVRKREKPARVRQKTPVIAARIALQ